MRPKIGAPFLLFFLKTFGNILSFAAAMGICANIKIQPLSAPIPEIAAPIATK